MIPTSERASRTICKSFVWSMVSKHALTSNFTKYSFGLQWPALDFCKDGRNTNSSQRLADVPFAETKFVFLQLLVYLIWSKDSIAD